MAHQAIPESQSPASCSSRPDHLNRVNLLTDYAGVPEEETNIHVSHVASPLAQMCELLPHFRHLASHTPKRTPSEDERNRRRTESHCFYCGAKGHLRATCPRRQLSGGDSNTAQKPLGQRPAQPLAAPVFEPLVPKIVLFPKPDLVLTASHSASPNPLLPTAPQESYLADNPLVLSGRLAVGATAVDVEAMVSCGVPDIALVDQNFAKDHGLELHRFKEPRGMNVADGRPLESGAITHIAFHQLDINGHQEELPMFVTKLGHYSLILGFSWMQMHEVAICFREHSLVFDSPHCFAFCGITSPVTAQSVLPPARAPLSKRQQKTAQCTEEAAVLNPISRAAPAADGAHRAGPQPLFGPRP